MNNSIQFSAKERHFIEYFRRLTPPSGRWRGVLVELASVLVSLVCAGLFVWTRERAWAVLAYAILVFRSLHLVRSHAVDTPTLCSIIAKYDARVRELESEVRDRSDTKQAPNKITGANPGQR